MTAKASRRWHNIQKSQVRVFRGYCNCHLSPAYSAEAGGLGAEGKAAAEAIEARLRTGRVLATEEWIKAQETQLGRALQPRRRGPKVKAKNGEGG